MSILRNEIMRVYDTRPSTAEGIMDIAEIVDRIAKREYERGRKDRQIGEWIDKGEYAECSICGAHSGTQFDGVEPIPLKTNFCHQCGADMRIEVM